MLLKWQNRARIAVLAVIVAWLSWGGAATVGISPGCTQMGSVAWTEKRLADGNVSLTLKATAEDGYAFSDWAVADSNVVAWTEDFRFPGPVTVIVASNASITASFVAGAEDWLSFDIGDLFPEEIACDEVVSGALDVDSASFPKVSFKNLPSGISYDERTLSVFGMPKSPGLYRIEADAVNGNGFTFRSFSTVRVGNVDGDRVVGYDEEIMVDEYYYAESSNLFVFVEEPADISLSANVPGLKWDKGWQLLYGTPTKIGVYTITATVRFRTGSVETATLTLSVVGADPAEINVDLDVLHDLQVGDELDDEIGENSSDITIRSVSGLPSGLRATSRFEDGARRWFVSGQVSEPGFYDVLVQAEEQCDETTHTIKVLRTVVVSDVEDVYLSVSSEDETRGNVTGGGAVSQFDDVTLIATARPGFVFSGWYDQYGECLVLQDGVDYRTPTVTMPSGTDFSFLAPVAHFASKAEDVAPDLSELEDVELSFAPDELFEETFAIESLSLPTLTFKGLPLAVKCAATGTGEFALTYDPTDSEAAPGRYVVTVTAVNRSGNKSVTEFRITVGNRTDSRIHVEDDYGEFTPGEEIDPISLADAVDFAKGETLVVSGLPKGLTYNAKANEKKGIDAYTITGTPTVPGEYTLKFTAKVISGEVTNKSGKVTFKFETATATSFITVLPYPELAVQLDDDAASAGCKVSGSGNYREGTKVTLKATAAKGWVFIGWDGLEGVDGLAALNPKLSYETCDYDVFVFADFTTVDGDWLRVNGPKMNDDGFAAAWELNAELDEVEGVLVYDLIETGSWPTVMVSGLPSGVKFDQSTFLLSGKPKKSGVYHVTVSAKNAGGYAFVRAFDIAVLNADRSTPEEKPYANPADIDFTPLRGLVTGRYYSSGEVMLTAEPLPETGAAVKKLSITGLPAGLTALTALDGEGGAEVDVSGTPTKPGRFEITANVTYDNGKSLKSQAAIVVEDGGSRYLYVSSVDDTMGTISGEGVYAAGATVKLVAKAKSKHVFSGWKVVNEDGEMELFSPLAEIDGIDPRTATISFPFRPADEDYGVTELYGDFVSATDDTDIGIALEDDLWSFDLDAASQFEFAVDSKSLPTITFKGLPKGVSVDAARGCLAYTPATAVPGIYTVSMSVKNSTVSAAVVTNFEVRVRNRVSEEIRGLDPDMDAYPLSVGVVLDSSLITPEVDDGWKLSASGLPSGLSFNNGAVIGTPSKAGNYTVTFTATTGSGRSRRTEQATITLKVAALPVTATGTFTGIITDIEDESVTGTFTTTVTAAGKISATVNTPAKKYSFSAKAWDSFVGGKSSVAITAKDSSLTMEIDSEGTWQSWQASGDVIIGEKEYSLSAQRNSYDAKTGDPDAVAAISAMAGKSTINGWTFKIDKKGTVAISGKYEGKSLSGSSILQYDENICEDNTGFFARYVKFPDKKTVLSLLFFFDEQGKAISWKVE